MNSAPPSSLEPGNPILGVFGFLDATLAPEQIQVAAICEIEPDRDRLAFRSLRGVVSKLIHETFRLQYWGCPLRTELAKYRLYNRQDMADALTVAYFFTKRGADPIAALSADYCLSGRGILTWEDIDQFREAEAPDENAAIWRNFLVFYKPGDRLIYYKTPPSKGYLLVRGEADPEIRARS